MFVEKKRRDGTVYYPPISPPNWKLLLDGLEAQRATWAKCKVGPVSRNIGHIKTELALDDGDSRLLSLLACYQYSVRFKDMVDKITSSGEQGYMYLLSKALDMEPSAISDRIGADSPLVESGMFIYTASKDDKRKFILPQFNSLIVALLDRPFASFDDIRAAFVGRPVKAEYSWVGDFAHLPDREVDETLLADAVKTRRVGFNMMYTGMPDIGKSQSVPALCAHLGLNCYSIGEKKSASGTEPKREDRMAQILMAQRFLRNDNKAVIMIDEFEDLVPSASMAEIFGFAAGGNDLSKIYMNRLLQENRVPAIFVGNTPWLLSQAFRRRFAHSREFEIPPAERRIALWNKMVEGAGRTLSAQDALELGRRWRSPIGMIAQAVGNATVLDTGDGALDRAEIERHLRVYSKRVYFGEDALRNNHILPPQYSTELINISLGGHPADGPEIADRIRRTNVRDFSVLAYGVSGAGKDSFGLYIADALGIEAEVVRASSWLGPYVGETEEKIKETFADERKRKTAIIVSEADTFLHPRRADAKSWEYSMVNELLSQMDSHTQPVIMTTNSEMRDIDTAFYRRFTWKMEFHGLSAGQVRKAFRLYFDLDAPQNLAGLAGVSAPGDFANVVKQLRIATPAERSDSRFIANLLVEEAQVRQPPSMPIGFVRPKPRMV